MLSTPPRASVPPEEEGRRRILVIDDNVAIHADFRKLLCPAPVAKGLDELDEAIFGAKASPRTAKSEFVVDAASQGQEGLEIVRRMQKLGRPYALTFVDMRMPPGWDG